MSVRERSKWRALLVPAVLALGIVGVIALASKRFRVGDARCDLFLLDARAPDLDAVELDDQALRALGGHALADILDSCDAIDEWTEYRWRLRVSTLLPDRPVDTILDLSGMPPAVVEQLERTCAGDFQDAMGEIQQLPARWRSYAIFETCKFESFGVLSSDDVDHVDPGYVADWRIRQLLLDSGVPETLANRYFTAILLATEISERAPGQVRLRAGGLEYDRRDGPLERVELPIVEREVIDHVFATSTLGESCDVDVSIATTEPIGNLGWLLEDMRARPRGCSTPTLTIAVSEREQLLRPLRATLEMPSLEFGRTAELEIEIDATGIAWRTLPTERHPKVEEGTNPAALAALLAKTQPKSLRVHAKEGAPADDVVDLLRAADVWTARNRKPMYLWLVIDPDPA